MRSNITIAEGKLTIEVIAGGSVPGIADPEFFARLKVHGTIKAGRTYDLELRREIRRLTCDEDVRDALRRGTVVDFDGTSKYCWRHPTNSGSNRTAKTASGHHAGDASWAKLKAITDRECSIFIKAHPGWEQYSLRLKHIEGYQSALAEVHRVQRSLDHAGAVAQQLRQRHQLTHAETTMQVPR